MHGIAVAGCVCYVYVLPAYAEPFRERHSDLNVNLYVCARNLQCCHIMHPWRSKDMQSRSQASKGVNIGSRTYITS